MNNLVVGISIGNVKTFIGLFQYCVDGSLVMAKYAKHETSHIKTGINNGFDKGLAMIIRRLLDLEGVAIVHGGGTKLPIIVFGIGLSIVGQCSDTDVTVCVPYSSGINFLNQKPLPKLLKSRLDTGWPVFMSDSIFCLGLAQAYHTRMTRGVYAETLPDFELEMLGAACLVVKRNEAKSF